MLLDSPAVKSAIERISAASEKYEETLRKKIELEQQQTGLTPEQKDEIAKITVLSRFLPFWIEKLSRRDAFWLKPKWKLLISA